MRSLFACVLLAALVPVSGCSQTEAAAEASGATAKASAASVPASAPTKLTYERLVGLWESEADPKVRLWLSSKEGTCVGDFANPFRTVISGMYMVDAPKYVTVIGKCFVVDDVIVMDPSDVLPADLTPPTFRSQLRIVVKREGKTLFMSVKETGGKIERMILKRDS
jgi:hypothetical protein